MANFDIKNLKALKKELKKQEKAEKEALRKQNQEDVLQKQENFLFAEAMQNVKPLHDNKTHHETIKPTAKLRNHSLDADELTIHDPLSDELEVDEVSSEDTLSFCRSGIQKNVFKKLRSGQYRISDELDLHGSSIKQAKLLLVYYLQEAVQFEGCCIRIIHGKGNRSGKKPVLKTYVNHWLREHDRVLAFHTTKIKDGGSGALYLLLKRQ